MGWWGLSSSYPETMAHIQVLGCAPLHASFLRLLMGWSSQCFLGGRQDIPDAFHQSGVCSWANWADGVTWLSSSKKCVSRELRGSSAFPTPLTRKVYGCLIRSAHGVLSFTSASIPVEAVLQITGLCWIINYVLKEMEVFLFKMFCTSIVFISLGV